MRSFADIAATLASVPGPVVTTLRRIDTAAGREALYQHQVPELLTGLAERARGESITASSALEGVVASPERARAIIAGVQGRLRNRDEGQLAGYREALDYLFSTDWRPLNVGLILHLHRLLWSQTASRGGEFKTNDNVVVDRGPGGEIAVRFRPVSAAQTEFSIHELVDRYREAIDSGQFHPVLLTGLFVLDLSVIHPFDDGNGRVARVLTNALLADAGYGIGRWISLEQVVADSADDYYDTLLASTHGWHEGTADVWPWLGYFTRVIATAYERFSTRVVAARPPGSKQERVRECIRNLPPGTFRINDVRAALPGISDNTIRLVLAGLKAEGIISSAGTGRSAVWLRA